jgi:hypothetical protein
MFLSQKNVATQAKLSRLELMCILHNLSCVAPQTMIKIHWCRIYPSIWLSKYINDFDIETKKTKLNSMACVRKWTILSDCRLLAKLVPTSADRGYHMVSVTDPYGFLDRSRYFFFQVAPQLYSRGWVDPVLDPLLLRKSGSAGNWTWSSGSVARNSDR